MLYTGVRRDREWKNLGIKAEHYCLEILLSREPHAFSVTGEAMYAWKPGDWDGTTCLLKFRPMADRRGLVLIVCESHFSPAGRKILRFERGWIQASKEASAAFASFRGMCDVTLNRVACVWEGEPRFS